MKLLKMMMMGVFLAGTPVLLSACEDETQLEESMEEAGDSIEDATD